MIATAIESSHRTVLSTIKNQFILKYMRKFIPAIILAVVLTGLLIWSSRIKVDYPENRIREGMDEFHKSDSMLKARRMQH